MYHQHLPNVQVALCVKPTNKETKLPAELLNSIGHPVFNQPNAARNIYNQYMHDLVFEVLEGGVAAVCTCGSVNSDKQQILFNQKTDENGLCLLAARELLVAGDVKVSVLRLYMEELQDMLSENVKSEKLVLRETRERFRIIVKGAKEVSIRSLDELNKILAVADRRATIEATRMGSTTSRNTKIVLLNCVNGGKITFIQFSQYHNTVNVQQEARPNISLVTFTNILTKMKQRDRHVFVPFRDSKATRLIHDSHEIVVVGCVQDVDDEDEKYMVNVVRHW